MHCVALEVDLAGSLPSGVIRELKSGLSSVSALGDCRSARAAIAEASGEFGFSVGRQES